jgi:glutathione peroxidase
MNPSKLVVVLALFLASITTNSQTKKNEIMSLYSIEINNLDGNAIDLNDYKGKYILFVNVASECGFTGQYADLQKLYDTYQDKLMVIGVWQSRTWFCRSNSVFLFKKLWSNFFND